MTIDAVVERIADGGNLLNNLKLLQDINSWQTSQEVWQAWQNGAPVEGVNTANMGIYRLVNGEVVFDLLGREGNLFIDDRFREDTYKGIKDNDFFFPSQEMKQHAMSAINAGKSITIHYSGLKVKTENCSSSYCYYIEATNKNTDEEKKLFSAVYGTDNPGNGKVVYLLRKNVVKDQLKNRKDDLIARACYFNYAQDFLANLRNFDDYIGAVRGVRRVDVAEGDRQKSNILLEAYSTIMGGINNLSDSQVFKLYETLLPRVNESARKQMTQ